MVRPVIGLSYTSALRRHVRQLNLSKTYASFNAFFYPLGNNTDNNVAFAARADDCKHIITLNNNHFCASLLHTMARLMKYWVVAPVAFKT